MINMNMNIKMHNMNQIYMQISQLMAQAMININQIMTNMNQLMTNMNQMNQLINSVNGAQPKDELDNINLMMGKIKYSYEFKDIRNIIFETKFNGVGGNIQCNSKEKLKDVIQKYRIKYGDTKSDTFIFNCQVLNLEKTIEENNIPNGQKILCLDSTAIKGGNENP